LDHLAAARQNRHAQADRGPTFLSSDHAIQALIRGEGVVLGRSALIGDELAAAACCGRLVRAFQQALSYYAMCPRRAFKRASVKAFRNWLISETHAGEKIHRTGG
jgi:LysR family glycine cleavage system transcriptional activator